MRCHDCGDEADYIEIRRDVPVCLGCILDDNSVDWYSAAKPPRPVEDIHSPLL